MRASQALFVEWWPSRRAEAPASSGRSPSGPGIRCRALYSMPIMLGEGPKDPGCDGGGAGMIIALSALLLFATASYTEGADGKKARKVEVNAERLARDLLGEPSFDKMVKAVKKLSREEPEARATYYSQIMKTAWDYLASTGGGPHARNAHLLLCGRAACEPAPRGRTLPTKRRGEPVARVPGQVAPPQKLFTPPPQYTSLAYQARIEGRVIIQAVLDEQGQLTNLAVIKGLPMGLTESVLKASERWKFAPATMGGEPVPIFYVLTINLRLP